MSVYRAPEPPPTLPRPIVSAKNSSLAMLWFPRLFIVPHTLVGLGLAVAFVLKLIGSMTSATTTAVVTDTHVYRGKGDSYSYVVSYSYEVGKHSYKGSDSIGLGSRREPAPGERYQIGQKVEVRYDGAGMEDQSHMENGGTVSVVFPMLFFVCFWNGIVSVFIYLLWYVPLRNRWLYRWGTAAPGRIVRKHTKEGKGTRYFIDYEFTTQWGAHRSETQQVSTKLRWDELSDGQHVNVLHHPDKASPSIVAEAGDYQWDTAAAR